MKVDKGAKAINNQIKHDILKDDLEMQKDKTGVNSFKDIAIGVLDCQYYMGK